jgi:regulatory protein
MKVTAVIRKGRSRNVDIYVEGELAITLERSFAEERGINRGREVTLRELGVLEYEDSRRRCLASAVMLLSFRARSERELRDRLRRKGFAKAPVDEALQRLRELGYLDDAAYAASFAESQQAARPRSRRLLTMELRRKGIRPEVADTATESVSDEVAAVAAAERRMRMLKGLAYPEFRERLGAFLTRRGFSYETARIAIERTWHRIHDEDGR